MTNRNENIQSPDIRNKPVFILDGGSSKQNNDAEPSRTTYTNSKLKTVTATDEYNDFHKDDEDDVYDDELEIVTKSPEEWLER